MTILKTELALPEYDTLTDQERYDSLHLKDIASKGIIQTHDIQIYFEFIDKLYTIRTHASDQAQHVTMVLDQFDHFDMSDSNQETVLISILQAIVDAGVITQGEMDTVIGYGNILVNRFTELGISSTNINDVTRART